MLYFVKTCGVLTNLSVKMRCVEVLIFLLNVEEQKQDS